MAEEFCGGANWWDSTPTNRSRFDGGGGGGGGGGGSSSTSSTTTLASSGGGPGFGWLTDGSTAVETKMDSSSLQLVGLGLSSQAMAEWNQQPTPLLRNPEKAENSFRSMLQEGMGLNTNFQQDGSGGGVMFGNNNNNNNSSQIQQWRDKLYSNNEDSSSEYKQLGRGFSLDNQQPQFSPSGSSIESTVTCQGLTTPSSFQLDSTSTSSVFGSPSGILQGLMGCPEQQQHQQQQLNNSFQQNYFGMGVANDHHHHQQQQQQHQSQLSPSWAKVPQFLRATSPKQQQQQQQLHFINNAPYWSASAPLTDVRPNNFFSSLQGAQLPNMPTFEEKPKTTMDGRDTSSIVKKSNSENNTKRSRNDGASSTLPPFKVRKEKMGDRITALQQLVSPFGKTDTASVLSEAIEYIKFLHEQVSVLSNPYLKSGGSYQQHQPSNEKAKMDPDGPKQDLRSRGLCLVPVSSTFPVTHETTVDFWTPTFGGTFR